MQKKSNKSKYIKTAPGHVHKLPRDYRKGYIMLKLIIEDSITKEKISYSTQTDLISGTKSQNIKNLISKFLKEYVELTDKEVY